MLLWIIRHGKAEKEAPSGRDEDRALRDRGFRQAAYLGAEFVGRDDAPTRLLSSPLTRAHQTAEAIASFTGHDVELSDPLISGRGPAGILALIEHLAAEQSLAIVGHNPELSQVVSVLAGPGVVEADWIRTGQAVGLELTPGRAPALVLDVLRLGD